VPLQRVIVSLSATETGDGSSGGGGWGTLGVACGKLTRGSGGIIG